MNDHHPMTTPQRLYVAFLEYVQIAHQAPVLKYIGIFTLDGLMEQVNYHIGTTFRVFIGTSDMPMDPRTMDNPHFIIHGRMDDISGDLLYTLSDKSLVLNEAQLRDIITGGYDPEDYVL